MAAPIRRPFPQSRRPSRAHHEQVDAQGTVGAEDARLYAAVSSSSSMATSDSATSCKLLLIGSSSVGKSSLLVQFSDNQWLPDRASTTVSVSVRVSHEPIHLFNAPVAYCLRIPGTQYGS